METFLTTLLASALIAAAEVLVVRLVQRWITPATRPAG